MANRPNEPKEKTEPKNPQQYGTDRGKNQSGTARLAPIDESNNQSTTTSQPNQSRNESRRILDQSGEICEVCHRVKGGAWVVQCDGCERWYHFNCVKFNLEEVPDDDPWYCSACHNELFGNNNPVGVTVKNKNVTDHVRLEDCSENDQATKSIVQTDSRSQHESNTNGRSKETMQSFMQWIAAKDAAQFGNGSIENQLNSTTRQMGESKRLNESSGSTMVGLNATKSSIGEQNQPIVIVTEAEIHREPSDGARGETVVNVPVTKVATHYQSIASDRNSSRIQSGNIQSGGVVPTKTLSTRASSTSSKKSVSSQHRFELEKQRLETEFEIQSKVDNERIALKLEALKLREEREMKLLNGMYQAARGLEEDELSDKSGSRGSKRNQSSRMNATPLVLEWIEDQRRKKSQMIQQLPDLSIEVTPKEIETVVESNLRANAQVIMKDGRLERKQVNVSISEPQSIGNQVGQHPTVEPNPEGVVMNSTLIQNNQPGTVMFDHQPERNEPTTTYPNQRNHPANIGSKHRNIDPTVLQVQFQSSSNPSYQQQGSTVTIPRFSTNYSTIPPNQQSSGPQMVSSNAQNNGYVGSTIPSTNIGQPHQSVPHQSSIESNHVRQQSTQVPSTYQTQNVDSFQYISNRPPLTAEQIAARHVVSKKLPDFNGDPKIWPTFIQKFRRTTASCGYDNSENLDRLVECLKKPARTIVQSQLTMPDFVPSIIATLEQKYGRKEIIVKAVLEEIRAEPQIKNDNLEALSNYGYKVQNVYHTIQVQQMDFYLHDPGLIQELVDKLPHQTKIDWARYSEELPEVTLVTLSEWLIRLSRSLNRITTPKVTSNSDDKKGDKKAENSKEPTKPTSWIDTKSGQSNGPYVNTHGDQQPNNNQTNGKQNSQCKYCSQNCKSLVDCSKFKGISTTERWKFVYANKRICRCCLQVHKNKCTVAKACGVNGCTYKHHTLLHDNEKMIKNKSNGQTNATSSSPIPNNAHGGGRSVLYKIIPVMLKNGDKTVLTCAYMDDGSGLTLMEQDVAEELGLQGTPQKLSLRWTNGTVRHENDSMRVVVEISGEGENQHIYKLRDVRTVESLDLPKQRISKESLVEKYPYLARIPFTDFDSTPKILIGLDNIKLCLSREHVEGRWSEPCATKTLLGWVVHGSMGPVSAEESQHMQHHVFSINECPCESERDDQLHQQIEEFFSLENFGVSAITGSIESKENQRAIRIMEQTTVRKNDRFETGLLWRYDDTQFPNNFGMAVKRLECQDKRMQSNPALMENINNQIRNFVKKGYARKLTQEEVNCNDPRVWYLPVFHCLDPKKPEKVRLVWDAAAKFQGISLNSMLMVGPDNLVSLVELLRRFREKLYAIGGDIEEMFHQVKVRKQDRCSLRFLWRDGNIEAKPEVYGMEVLPFGTNCSPCLAQNVKNKNASEFEENFPEAANAIKRNHYVDDWLDCQHTVEDTIRLAKDVKYVHSQGGFNLRKFMSNSKEVLEALGNENGETTKNLDTSTSLNTQKVLGMWWDAKTDCFTYSLKYTKLNEEVLLGLRAPTKREILKTLMSIFDPLGLIAFYRVQLKILLQEIWKRKVTWDEQLPTDLNEGWKRWINLLPRVEGIRIPRLYSPKLSPNTAELIELHTFVDASKDAYCAVSFLRIVNGEGVDCVLIGAKTKVAPIKPLLTIPRLELMGAVLGTRHAKSIGQSLTLSINKRYFWSDSRDVMCWIRSTTRKYRQFVAFRIGEILEASTEIEWRWLPGKLNVADEGTKWSKVPNFEQNCRWFKGPEFLYEEENSWPQDLPSNVSTEEELHVHIVHTKLQPPSQIVPKNFSKWSTLVNAQALSTRYLEMLIAKVKGQSIVGPLKTAELKKAERTLYKLAQFDGFYDEIMKLKSTNGKVNGSRKSGVKKSSRIYKMSPYLDENGLLRVRGRIDKIDGVKYETKRPIILPKNHKITELVVLNYHQMYLHGNNETVLNELNQRFRIPSLRKVIKTVVKTCQTCKIRKAKPVPPEMGDLPIARLSPGFRCFTYTGVDYFGPMYVVVKKSTEKRWGVLFTCMTLRAIHIEIVPSLNTDSCILCVRNFTNLRGTPVEFRSDNGTSMKAADKELREEFDNLDKDKIQSHFTRTYTTWTFNPPAAPHFGGAWERLIGSVKNNLKMVMFTRTPKEELLRSYLWEVVNIINSRPLTYIPLESEEDEALTPNHFIFGTSNGHMAPGDFPCDEVSLRKAWRRSQELTNKFWTRWIKEYLPTITCRSKWLDKTNPIKVGDLVLLVDEKNSRNSYPRGKVIEVFPDKKGVVRQATIRIAEAVTNKSGQKTNPEVRYSIKKRPITKLAVLEVKGIEVDVKTDGTSTSLNEEEYVADGNTVSEKNESLTTDNRKGFLVRRSKRIATCKSN